MIAVREKENEGIYLSSFSELEKRLAPGSPSWLQAIRRAAIDVFAERGFPTTKEEEWRFTNVAPIASRSFRPGRYELTRALRQAILSLPLADLGCPRMVFINGHYCAELSTADTLAQGATAGSLASALRTDGAALEAHLARYADYRDHSFVALNTAFLEDGGLIEIPKGVVLEKPIQLLFVSQAGNGMSVSHPRNLILAGRESQATIIETYVGLNGAPPSRASGSGSKPGAVKGAAGGVYFSNAVTEIVTGEGAHVQYIKVQQESMQSFHYARVQVQQERSSSVTTNSVALGGGLAREEVCTVLDGEGAEATLNGLYALTGAQHVDNHTLIDHAKPHCGSREFYKGVLDGKSTAVFNGAIRVRQDAQKTDSKQSNKNLLLSEDAVINTKPQLEIYADDVKCTHGATIGRIDPEAIFYLRTRGIALAEARNLLTYAFANDVLGRIQYEPLRQRLEGSLFARLGETKRPEEA
jgi:Fe-S cluster assembly protein SufD